MEDKAPVEATPKKPSRYITREVSGSVEAVAETLHALHYATFGDSAPKIDPGTGSWWIAYMGDTAVGFAGLLPSQVRPNTGYLCRSGVLKEHRGHGLQRRMIRLREARARRRGWSQMVTDTSSNIHSANSLIRAGYTLFVPDLAWGYDHTLYWRKKLA